MTYGYAEADPGTGGPLFAIDLIGSWQYPLSKVGYGVEGTWTAVTSSNGLPIQADQLPTKKTTVPSPHDAGLPVRQIGQDTSVCSFAAVGSGLLTTDMTQRTLGTGVGVSQANGNLLVTTGTTTNAEFLARSVDSWEGAMYMRYQAILSQRIANQNFMVLLADMVGEGLTCTINSATSITVALPGHTFTAANVGQSMFVGAITGAAGVPGRYAIASVVAGVSITFTVAGWPASGSCTVDLFGWNYVKNLYSGVTATNSLFDCQRRGWNSGDTTATINTTASPGHMAQFHLDGSNCYFGDMLVASNANHAITTRASRVVNTPDDDVQLYVYLWSYNGTTAPASTTTWTVGVWRVEEYANNPVYLAGSKLIGTPAPMPVINSGTFTVSFTQPALVAGTALIGYSPVPAPTVVADVASAAITTTTTTAAVTPGWGNSYEVNIPVTVVSGTNPTIDIVVEESDDSGTNWMPVYQFERIIATGIYRSPKLPLTGNRVRYVQTVGGATPSFTRAINRLQSSETVLPFRQIYDRAINPNLINATTSALYVNICRNLQLVVNMGAITTTPPQFQLQVTENGADWISIGTALTSVANSTVSLTINNVHAQRVRAIETVAGSGATLGYILIKGF